MWGWGETDLANTYFEGGLYLIIVWWGFRLAVAWKLIRMYWLCSQEAVLLPLAFILAYAVITAVFGTLGIPATACDLVVDRCGILLCLERNRKRW
jgi:hypothetical protein